MNKYQKRRNKMNNYKIFLSKDKINEIIYDDKQYNSFLKYIEKCESVAQDILKSMFKTL